MTSTKFIGQGLTYDDVLLVPSYSDTLPREVSIKSKFSRNIPLNIPIISAAMDTVTESRMAIAIASEGGILISDPFLDDPYFGRSVVILCEHNVEGTFGFVLNNYAEIDLHKIDKKFPDINALMYVINEKKNDTIYDLDVVSYSGKAFIMEEMEGLKFKIGPKSFFQTNSKQAIKLYEITRDFAGITKEDVVYDLYTGTGTIANFIARSAKKVIGVESVPDAIEDAKINSVENGIENTVFSVSYTHLTLPTTPYV